MARPKKLDAPTLRAEMIKVKVLIGAMADAMPRAAADLRREAQEAIDDLLAKLPT